MSDNPLLAFTIGSLAASRGSNELARLSASVMAPRPVRNQVSGSEVTALIKALQEQEQYIASQEALIARLRQVSLEWQEYGKKLKAKHTKLEEWADWAERELKNREEKA